MRLSRLLVPAFLLGFAALAPGADEPPALPPPPGLADLFLPSRPEVTRLLEDEAWDLALEATRRLLADPAAAIEAFDAWSALREHLGEIDPGTYERAIAATRAFSPGGPATDLLEALGRGDPRLAGYHRAPRARELYLRVAEGDRPDLAALARFEIARQLVPGDPGAAAALLRSLPRARAGTVAPTLQAVASLQLGALQLRLDQAATAVRTYREALRRFASLELRPEGLLEPWIRHGLAEALLAAGQPEAAATELRQVRARFPDYPQLPALEEQLEELR